MSIEVIGAGFGRTGTMSLKAALEELGFSPCYHMTEVFANPDHVGFWETAVQRRSEGKPGDWQRVFRDYRAAVDWPAAAFYEELMEEYPDAKVILTIRDPDKWYESVRSTIYTVQNVASSRLFSLSALLVPRLRHTRRAALMVADLVWQHHFDGRFEDREHATSVFDRWNAEVRERVPPEKLLVYEISEGWEPLCEFLGVEAPEDRPFPHLNDAEAFRKMVRQRTRFATAALIGAASLAVIAILYFLSRRDARS